MQIARSLQVGVQNIFNNLMCVEIKPFKAMMTKFYDQWLSEGVHKFTEGGNMKTPSRKKNN